MPNFNKYKGFIVHRDVADRFIDAETGIEIFIRANGEGGFACTARRADFLLSELKFEILSELVEELSEHAIGVAALVLAIIQVRNVREQERDFPKAVFAASDEAGSAIIIGGEL